MNDMSELNERVRGRMGGGIWPRSSRSQYFLFCVGQDLIKVNAFVAWAVHHDIHVKPLVGQYNGQSERSFVANYNDFLTIRPWLNDEESMLILGACNGNNEPMATLHYLDTGVEVDLGRLVIADRDAALGQRSWTYDPFTKNYFVCTEDGALGRKDR